MPASRINPPGWGVGDELTYAQVNALDIRSATTIDSVTTEVADRIAYALDKRSGHTDALASTITRSGTGRIVDSAADTGDADASYTVATTINRVTSAVTANRIYTLSPTAAQAGDRILFFCDASFVTYKVTIKDQAAATLFVIGNIDAADGTWCEFVYMSSGWHVESHASNALLRSQLFTSSGTWTCPADVTSVTVLGVGGGGGGGGGYKGYLEAIGSGGGGGAAGGGALAGTVVLAVTPGTAYTITIGAGGAGGTGSTAFTTPTQGAGGNDSTFDSLATFYGAQGGEGGQIHSDSAASYSAAGGSRKGPARTTSFGVIRPQGHGGSGWRYPAATPLAASTDQTIGVGSAVAEGGAGGVKGTDDTSDSGQGQPYGGGGGGGGGGASGWPGGSGGAGGAGGNGDGTISGVGGPGIAGTAGTFGGGGGGGGGGGAAYNALGLGAAGAAGGNGAILITWVK